MKINLTDQFLWDMYSFFEKAGDITRVVFRRRRTLYDVSPGPKNPVFEKYKKMNNRRQFNNLIYQLKKHNFIKVENLKGNNAIMLTKKGIDKAIRARFKLEKKNDKKRKDGKWIMIIFDIPQSRRKSRNLLRSILKNLGYKMFQHSVWITPYDVSEKTEELLQWYSLDSYIRLFLIEKL